MEAKVLPLIRSPPEEVQHLGDVQLAMSMMGNKLAQEVTVLHSREKSSTSLPYRLMGKTSLKILKFLIWAEKGCDVCVCNIKKKKGCSLNFLVQMVHVKVKWILFTS